MVAATILSVFLASSVPSHQNHPWGFPTASLARRPSSPILREEEPSMKYKIALEHSDEGYSVSVPGLPGCWSQGATETEALANIRAAISEYLIVRDELVRDADVREVEVV